MSENEQQPQLRTPLTSPWTRRAWLQTTTQVAAYTASSGMVAPALFRSKPASLDAVTLARVARHAELADPAGLEALAMYALDAARSHGASYADTRLTRTVQHGYYMAGEGVLWEDEELIGVGVRVLVNGCWGFAASPMWDTDEVVRLAVDAVEQARANALGVIKPVELAMTSVTKGQWATPLRIDPFAVTIEEKCDHIVYWKACAGQAGLRFDMDGLTSHLKFARQEQVLATTEGTLMSQTRYETGGDMSVLLADAPGGPGSKASVNGLETAGKGWELFLDAKIPEQFPEIADDLRHPKHVPVKPVDLGRYTVVCDGDTMASILDETIGLATQLDVELGYEANAGGSGYLDDPLNMIGTFQVASPLVTVTANRSASGQLATVKWDAEGVEPLATTLVKKGILTNFQTTREQATWLASYYTKTGQPVRSNGCAGAEDALSITLQQMPNLEMAPNASNVSLEALIGDVEDGILVVDGRAACDFQGRTGVITGGMREIKKGKLGSLIAGGSVYFSTLDLWKRVSALGGASSQGTFRVSQFELTGILHDVKGEPMQRTSHSAVAPAATITNQAVVNLWRKA
jgi:TldD protein